MRLPFVGVGTGRCGTTSLARIVNACKNTNVVHEKYLVPWYPIGTHQTAIMRLINRFKADSKKDILSGEVANYLLPNIGLLRKVFPRMPVVVLHRDKKSTVESFIHFGSCCLRPLDRLVWAKINKPDTIRRTLVDRLPAIDAANPKQAFEFFWEMYEEHARKIEEPVLHVEMENLNDNQKIVEIMSWLGIPEDDRVLIDKRKWWTRDDADAAREAMNSGDDQAVARITETGHV